MKNRYKLPILPEDKILFLDNSAFGLPRASHPYDYNVQEAKKELSRLIELTERLSEMDNWTTTKAVIEEFKSGNKRFERGARAKCLRCAQLSAAFSRLVNQREKTLGLLDNSYKITNGNLTSDLIEKVNEFYPIVTQAFKKFEKYAKKKTHIELISTALAFATNELVCIFSHDENLLRTYSFCARQNGIYINAYIINSEFSRNINTLKYE